MLKYYSITNLLSVNGQGWCCQGMLCQSSGKPNSFLCNHRWATWLYISLLLAGTQLRGLPLECNLLALGDQPGWQLHQAAPSHDSAPPAQLPARLLRARILVCSDFGVAVLLCPGPLGRPALCATPCHVNSPAALLRPAELPGRLERCKLHACEHLHTPIAAVSMKRQSLHPWLAGLGNNWHREATEHFQRLTHDQAS